MDVVFRPLADGRKSAGKERRFRVSEEERSGLIAHIFCFPADMFLFLEISGIGWLSENGKDRRCQGDLALGKNEVDLGITASYMFTYLELASGQIMWSLKKEEYRNHVYCML